MRRKAWSTVAFLLCACSLAHVSAGAQDSLATPNQPAQVETQGRSEGGRWKGFAAEPRVSLRDRIAQRSARLESPDSLFEIKQTIQENFDVILSIEPLPEQCAGAENPRLTFEPFTINIGERFGDVVVRLEEASQGRWIYEEIHGVPLLRPNNAIEGHGTLLDTVISVDIDAASMWDAICAVARAVNKVNDVHNSGSRGLIILFPDAGLLRYPPASFVERKQIRVTLDRGAAREALCAVISQMGNEILIKYSYNCYPNGKGPTYDYVSVSAYDYDGKVVNGGKMRGEDINRIAETVDWMSNEGILAVQAPKPDTPTEPKLSGR